MILFVFWLALFNWSARQVACFLTSSNFCRFFDILREIFDFSRLVSLFCNSAQSPFKQQLLSKAIQNEESPYKKNQNQK